MRQVFLHIILCVLAIHTMQGQISPGKLTDAHADLEGISNCTLCHDLGSKVSNTKCLDCHKEIQSLIDKNRGYHARFEAKSKDCFACHSEHHGRKFNMSRFDESAFDHDLTGYELEGQHDVIECRECHIPDFIADPEIRDNEDTFLGLEQECLSCHEDYHRETLGNDCYACHDIEAWRPAPKFDHDKTDYPLEGAHVDVDCVECHRKTAIEGKEFQQFTDLQFNDCVACHEDPHRGRIEGQCKQCHNVNSFTSFDSRTDFDHSTTDFSLKGMHRTVDCFECHKRTDDPRLIFKDNIDVAENECAACHEDVHNEKLGSDCAQCHNEMGWAELNADNPFSHDLTDYPLEGKHIDVECRECHGTRTMDPIDFSECQNCHEDYHKGQFVENGRALDCMECHSLHEGFEYSLYTLEDHQRSEFPLLGSHLATPCFACHLDEREDWWSFRDIGSACVDCHEDIHEGYISEKYYPENECAVCHNNDTWTAATFDHDRTEWPLEGKHAEVDCRECHFTFAPNGDLLEQVFSSLSGDCVSCHENVHGDEHAINGVTDCTRCHSSEDWYPKDFDHDSTAFPLEGRHAEIECRACHEVAQVDGSTDVIFKLEKLQCVDCHSY